MHNLTQRHQYEEMRLRMCNERERPWIVLICFHRNERRGNNSTLGLSRTGRHPDHLNPGLGFSFPASSLVQLHNLTNDRPPALGFAPLRFSKVRRLGKLDGKHSSRIPTHGVLVPDLAVADTGTPSDCPALSSSQRTLLVAGDSRLSARHVAVSCVPPRAGRPR